MNFNQTTIYGRLSANPHRLANGRVWGRLVVARPGGFETEFIPFSLTGPTADAVITYCSKGKTLIITGELRSRKGYLEIAGEKVVFGSDGQKAMDFYAEYEKFKARNNPNTCSYSPCPPCTPTPCCKGSCC